MPYNRHIIVQIKFILVATALLFPFNMFLYAETSDESIIDLGTIVTVVGKRHEDLSFSAEDIATSTAANLQEFLADNNCLVLSTGGIGSSSNVSIRGYAGACIKVYVDGVLANDPNTGEFDWNSIPLEAIANIVVQDMPVVGQEQFSGSTVSITTKSYSERKISFSVQSLSYDSNPMDSQLLSLVIQDVLAGTAFKLALSSIHAENEYYGGGSSIHTDGGYNSYSGFLNWNRYIGAHSIGGNHSVSRHELSVPAALSSAGVQETFFSTHTLFANLFFPFGLGKISFTYDFDSLEYTESGEVSQPTDNDFHSFTMQASHSFPIRKFSAVTLEPVVSVKGNFTKGLFSSGNKAGSDDGGVKFSPSRTTFYPSVAAKLKAAFVQLQPVVGYLFVRDSSFSGDIVRHAFNAAVSVVFWDALTVSAATQNALPTFNQLYWNYAALTSLEGTNAMATEHGNPALVPESGYSIRLTFSNVAMRSGKVAASFARLFPFNVSFGFSYYKDKIRWVSDYYNGSAQASLFPQNAGAAYYFDATLNATNQFCFGGAFYAGYNVKLAVTKTYLLSEPYVGNQIMWVPLVLLNSSLSVGYKDVSFSLRYDFTSRRYTSNYNTTYYAPVHLLGCSIDFKYGDNVTFILEVDNILDQRYLYHDGYYAPSRSYSVKIKATF